MKLTRRGWLRSLARVAGCAVTMWLAGMAAARAQAVITTAVQGTVYLANGQPAAGTLVVSWPTFTTAAGQLISAGQTTVTVGADGFVSVNLAPNQGATPAGEYYTAVFYKSDGSVSTQYWLVPAAAQASLAQVQAQVMPAAQAVQAVSKAYVDQTVSQALGSQLLSSGGNLTGPLYLIGDPSQPLQAADKHYVDSSFSAALPLSGGTITGPASFSATVTFGSSVTASSGIDFTGAGAAQTLANLLPGAASNGANGIAVAGAVSAASVNGVWDLKTKFGAVGSDETMSCTATASSYTLTGCSGGDFTAGEYVFLPFAGASPTISTPSAPTVSCGSDNGGLCSGSTVYAYEIVAVQSGYVNGPLTAPSASTSVTQATQTAQSPQHSTAADVYTNVSWSTVIGAIGYAIYKSINSGPFNFYEVVNSSTTSIKDFNHAQSAQFTCTDMGYPCTAPGAATASGVFAQIASVSGSTVTLQARSVQPADPSQPGISGSVTVNHDDSPAFYALYQAAAANAGGQIQVHIPAGNYVVHPYNQPPGSSTSRFAVMMLDGLSNLTISGDGEGVSNIYVYPSSPMQYNGITGEFIDGVSGYGNSCGASFGGSGAGYAISDPALVGSTQVTLSTLSNSSHFSAGGYVTVYNNASGYPWEFYGELNKVLSINATTGVLTLAYPLTKTYSAALPAPYSSCSACSAAPVIAPAIACSSGIDFQNMTVRGPVLFANISTADGFTLNRMDIEVLNTVEGGTLRHVSTLNNKILEDTWGPNVSSLGLISVAAASSDEVVEGNTYKNPHLGPVGWQQCTEGGANITDQNNVYQLSGSVDQNSAPNSNLFQTPECFNYTMQGDTVNISDTNLLGVFGGDFNNSGASGAIKDNTISVDSAGNTQRASIGSAIGFGSGFGTSYMAVDKNKWVTPASQYLNLGPVTANANDLIGNYRTIALTEASNDVNFNGTYGSANVYTVNLTQNLFSVVFGSTRIAGYKFDIVFNQPFTGTPAAFYVDSACSNGNWNTGGSGVDCQNNPPPTVPFLLGASVVTHWYDDGTTLHYLGENFRNPRLTIDTMPAQSGTVTTPTYLGYQMTIVPMSGNITSVNTGFYRQSTGTGYFYGIAFQQPASGGPYTLPSTCAQAQWNDGTIDFQGGVCPAANPAAGSTTTIWFWFDGAASHEVSRSYWAPGTGPSGYNNVIQANAESGADACAKINAAESALPNTGGVIDARGFQGTQTCAGTIGPITKIGELILGAATFQVQSPVMIESSAVTIEGAGWQAQQSGGSLSVIQAGSSFSGTDVIQVGGNNTNVSGTNITYLQINCNSVSGTNGIGLLPGSGVAINGAIDRVYAEKCPGNGLYAVGSGTHDWSVTKSRFEYNGTGVNLESNAWRFVSDEVDNNTTDGYHIDNSFAISITGDVETNGVNNIHFTNRDGNVAGVTINAVYFEPSSSPTTQRDIKFDATGTNFFRGIDVSGSYFQGDSLTPYAIEFPSTLYVEGADFHGNYFAGYTTDAVHNQGGAEATFSSNYWGSTAFDSSVGLANGTTHTGTATLVAGTVTAPTSSACVIGASCTYQLTHCVTGGTEGNLSVGTITAGTSFVINSSSSTDTSQVCWTIIP